MLGNGSDGGRGVTVEDKVGTRAEGVLPCLSSVSGRLLGRSFFSSLLWNLGD